MLSSGVLMPPPLVRRRVNGARGCGGARATVPERAEVKRAVAPGVALGRQRGMVHPWYIAPTPEANSSRLGFRNLAIRGIHSLRRARRCRARRLRFPGSPTIRVD